MWTGFKWLMIRVQWWSLVNSHETMDSITGGEFPEQLSDLQLLKDSLLHEFSY
jgi:hypothetical protein